MAVLRPLVVTVAIFVVVFGLVASVGAEADGVPHHGVGDGEAGEMKKICPFRRLARALDPRNWYAALAPSSSSTDGVQRCPVTGKTINDDVTPVEASKCPFARMAAAKQKQKKNGGAGGGVGAASDAPAPSCGCGKKLNTEPAAEGGCPFAKKPAAEAAEEEEGAPSKKEEGGCGLPPADNTAAEGGAVSAEDEAALLESLEDEL
jgi:hypothetical protein